MRVRQRRETARYMGPWDTDNDGNYARGKGIVDPVVFMVCLIPVLGAFLSIASMIAGYEIGERGATGVGQQAIRTGHVGLVVQAISIVVLGPMLVIVL